jgi:NTP pyrophosphatase (non-canonical NTP hydrolase)
MRSDDLKALAERFERASSSYGEIHGIERDPDWFLLKMQEELGELTQAWLRHTKRARPRSGDTATSASDLADEAADLLGHVLTLAHRLDLDLAGAIRRKWRFDPAEP